MRLDQFSGIVAFVKVAQVKSFTRAAAELGVAPASLGEAVKGLEERLGVRLLNRTTRSVGLTEAGAHYLDHVRPAAEEIWAAGAALRETRDRPAGTLRLSLPWIAAPLLIEPLMGPFMDAYPEVRLSVIFDDNFVDIAAQGFDAGLRIGELLEKDMIGARLGGPLQTVVLGSPDYLARNGTPTRLADLAAHRCIAFAFTRTRAISPWEFVVDERHIEFTPDARLIVNTLPLCITAAAQGLGLAFAVEGLAAPLLASGALVKVLEPFCPSYEPLHLYYPSRRLVPPKLRAFIDFVRANAHNLRI
ncbi:LysR family transcriptional regulator [Mesorhizobium sp. ISC15]|uniref:LysR family transcriptional regulator n=1 Tax=Mesorhizobium sp. ISC15 TaxID=3076429 RepID=UPI00301CCCEB